MFPELLIMAALLVALVARRVSEAGLPLGVVGTVGLLHNPGHIVPGLDGVQESQRATFQYGAAVTSHQFTFNLDGPYRDLASLALAAPIAWISAKAVGSATASIASIVLDSVSLTQVKVTVTVDAAPGVGKTTDVACSILVAGKAVS